MLRLLLLLLAAQLSLADRPVLGGYQQRPQGKNDLHVQEIADFAVQQLAVEENAELDMADIISVSTQVVAGTNYRLEVALTNGQVFELTVFESLNGKTKQLTASKRLANRQKGKTAPPAGSKQRSLQQNGASSPSAETYKTVKSPNLDDGTMFAAREVAEYLTDNSNSLYPYTVSEITSAAVKKDGQDEHTYVVRVQLDQQSLPSATVDAQVSRNNMNAYKVLQITKPKYLPKNNRR